MIFLIQYQSRQRKVVKMYGARSLKELRVTSVVRIAIQPARNWCWAGWWYDPMVVQYLQYSIWLYCVLCTTVTRYIVRLPSVTVRASKWLHPLWSCDCFSSSEIWIFSFWIIIWSSEYMLVNNMNGFWFNWTRFL